MATLPVPAEATRASFYIYVEEVDVAYQRALDHGSTSLAQPEDRPYHERAAGMQDSFGNTWWISTFKQPVRNSSRIG